MILRKCSVCDGTGADIYYSTHTEYCKMTGNCPGIPECPLLFPRVCPYCDGNGTVEFDYAWVNVKLSFVHHGDNFLSQHLRLKMYSKPIRLYLNRLKLTSRKGNKAMCTMNPSMGTTTMTVWHTAPSLTAARRGVVGALTSVGVDDRLFSHVTESYRPILGCRHEQ